MKLLGTVTILAGILAISAISYCFNDSPASRDSKILSRTNENTSAASVQDVEPTPKNSALLHGGSSFNEPGTVQTCEWDEDMTDSDGRNGVAPVTYLTQCDGNCNGCCAACQGQPGVKMLTGVDGCNFQGREPRWRDQKPIPWEQFSYGEYIGPFRTPHVGEYRLRVDDELDFVYLLTREKMVEPYRLYVGDVIQISSAIDENLNQTDITILSDGTISLRLIGLAMAAGKTIKELQADLNKKYSKFVRNPAIVVAVIKGDTPLNDLRDAVDARQGVGGQNRLATVAPDGTFQLPLIGSVPAVGLTLNEVRREVNSRYRASVSGIQVTPVLTQRAPRFIYVVGEVGTPGRFELTGPTTVVQALALADGFVNGGNIRQAIVFRRDQDWRLIATRLDLSGALYGKTPHPSDDLWLRDSDVVLIPQKPIKRFADAIDLYFTQSFYGIFPFEAFVTID